MKASNDLMNMAFASARHAAARQELISKNLANADTPRYRAQDLDDFTPDDASSFTPAATRPTHFLGAMQEGAFKPQFAGGALAPNGNDVSIETEMVRGVDARRQHDAAMAIYRASLDILRTSLGRR